MSKNKEERKPVKRRKRRKPMTEEQKLAASERLEKARKARAKKNPDYGMSGIHETLRNLEDNHFLHPKKVKEWIKTQKELASSERASVRQKIKGAYAKQLIHEGYVRRMQSYLKTGDWADTLYGEHQEHKIKYRCVSLSYEKDGTPNNFVNVTGMQRLHNGAIWQQYTEMEKMKELMYDTMVELIGKEQADKKLEKHDIKLLDESLDVTDSLWSRTKNKVKSLFKVVKD